MIRREKAARILLFYSITLAAAVDAPAQEISFRTLDAYVERAMADWGVPGLSLVIVKDDAVLYAKGYGVREAGKSHRVDEHTLFAIASNTKAFTATLLGMLVDENRIDWDDRVIDRLPGFRMYDSYTTREIRLRDCLTHRSGLPTFGGDRMWIGAETTKESVIERIRHMKPTAPFRAEYQYNNLMFLVAGQMFAAAAGQSWEEGVASRIFGPLGMRESRTTVRDLGSLKNVATPHEIVGGELVPVAYDNVDAVAPAAAVVSSAADMARWMRLHLNRGRFEGRVMISEGVAGEIQSVQFPLPVSEISRTYLGAGFSGYGLGWGISEYHGYRTVSHGGGLSGMISRQTLVPELGLGVMVMSNFAPNQVPTILVYRILDLLTGNEQTDWNRLYLDRREAQKRLAEEEEGALRAARVTGTLPSHPLYDYAGIYAEPVTGKIEIRMEAGRLLFEYNPRYRGDLEHWHYDTFRVHWRHPIFDMDARTFLTFRFHESGEVSGCTVKFYYPVEFRRLSDQEYRGFLDSE